MRLDHLFGQLLQLFEELAGLRTLDAEVNSPPLVILPDSAIRYPLSPN